MKISIIIPYKNAEAYIGRCADSLRQQDGDFEFIFVNDHSIDNGYNILKSKTGSDSRFVRITDFSPYGSGVSAARNAGLHIARGEYITFLDADDELLPGAREKYEEMLKTDADIHQANHIRWVARNNQITRRFTNPERIYEIPELPEMWSPVWNKLYKAELIKNIKFEEGMRFGEDEIFNVDCISKAKRIHSAAADIMKHNLENPESLSRTKTDEDIARLLTELIKRIPKQEDPRMRLALYNTIEFHINTAWVYNLLTGKQ